MHTFLVFIKYIIIRDNKKYRQTAVFYLFWSAGNNSASNP